jgi:hypothetical protein
VVARVGRLTTIAALLVTIAGCGGASTDAKGDDPPVAAPRPEVVLLHADDPGQAPFGPSFGESLAASIDRGLPGDAIGRSLSVEPVDGAEPGLYGRIDLQAPCDLEGLVDLYAASPALTEVVAAVLDVSAIQLSSFLRSYVAVATTRDTFVIDHRLVDGAAVRSPAVLEAGTTVLIDDRGPPRMRCASASPLTQPRADEVAGIGDADRVGAPWTGFDPDRIVVVEPAPEQISALDLAALVR